MNGMWPVRPIPVSYAPNTRRGVTLDDGGHHLALPLSVLFAQLPNFLPLRSPLFALDRPPLTALLGQIRQMTLELLVHIAEEGTIITILGAIVERLTDEVTMDSRWVTEAEDRTRR